MSLAPRLECDNSSALLANTRLPSIPAERIRSRSPLRSGQHHIDLPAASLGTYQPLAPIEHGRFGAVPGSHLRRGGFPGHRHRELAQRVTF